MMVLFPFILPLLVLPLLIGGYLLSRSSASPLTNFMALLTLKPVLATPLWLGLVQLSATPSWTDPIPDALLYALPGIGLTLLIVWWCRASLRGQSGSLIVILLLMDTLRWGSTALTQGMGRPAGAECLFMLSLTMPSVLAVVAWLLDRRLAGGY